MTNMSKEEMDEIDQSMKDMEDECPKSELPEDMTPEEYKKVVINFYAYGPNVTYTCAYTVTGTGTFEFVADSMVAL